MLFTGIYEHTIDAKNRLSVPAAFRSNMDPKVDGESFYLAPGDRPNTLALWGERIFEANAAKRREGGLTDPRRLDYDHLYYATAWHLELDKLGRIRIPDLMLQNFNIQREVTITGSDDHIVIWNKNDFKAFLTVNLPRYAEARMIAYEAEREAKTLHQPSG